MTIFADSAPVAQTLEDLLPRLAAARRLVADIEAEVRALGRHAPLTPLCGHPDRPLAGVLVNGQPACNDCAAKSIGIPPRDVTAITRQPLSDTERAWANRDLDGDLAKEWGTER